MERPGPLDGLRVHVWLWIVREVAEAHGGTVGLESTAGRGSRFWLAVPEASAEAPTRLHDPGARSGYDIG